MQSELEERLQKEVEQAVKLRRKEQEDKYREILEQDTA